MVSSEAVCLALVLRKPRILQFILTSCARSCAKSSLLLQMVLIILHRNFTTVALRYTGDVLGANTVAFAQVATRHQIIPVFQVTANSSL